MNANRMQMNVIRLGLALLSAGSAMGLSAKTVGWWRFGDLGADGGKAVAGTVFANSVDSAKYPAIPHSFDNLKTPGTDATYMPSLVKLEGATSALRVYDPVGDKSYPFSTALSCPWGGNGTGLSGGATVALAPELYGGGEDQSGDVTFECFFRTSAASMDRSASMVAIFSLMSQNGNDAMSLIIRKNGAAHKLWIRFAVDDGKAEQGSLITDHNFFGKTDVAPDRWHHAAFVYEFSTHTAKMYLDYVLEASCTADIGTGTGKLRPYSANEPIYFGKTMSVNADRSLAGEMAEARLSDAALTPDKFLRFEPEVGRGDRASTDPDLIYWSSLDGDDATIPIFDANPGILSPYMTKPFLFKETLAGATPGNFVAGGTSATVVRARYASAPDQDNAGCYASLTNDAPNTALELNDPNGTASAGSFTEEILFRTAHPVIASKDSSLTGKSFVMLSSVSHKFVINQFDADLQCVFKSAAGSTVMDATGVDACDGRWHHLAFVYDADIPCAKAYFDGKCFATYNGAVLSGSGVRHMIGAAYDTWTRQGFDGWLDEYRLTARALLPEEFIACNRSVNAIAWARFENDFNLAPYDYLDVSLGTHVIGSGVPVFTEGRAPEIDTAKGHDDRMEDKAGLKVEGGKAIWSDLPRGLARSNVTIEYFFRPYGRFSPQPCVVGMAADRDSLGITNERVMRDVPWEFGYEVTWTNPRLLFSFACTNVADGTVTTKRVVASPAYSPDLTHKADTPVGYGTIPDTRWHHVAVTLAEFEEGGITKTTATTYWDYKEIGTDTLVGKLNFGNVNRLIIGTGEVNDRESWWDMDELRISDGILAPDQFLYKSRTGMLMIVR